jgi:hypothetical protein
MKKWFWSLKSTKDPRFAASGTEESITGALHAMDQWVLAKESELGVVAPDDIQIGGGVVDT